MVVRISLLLFHLKGSFNASLTSGPNYVLLNCDYLHVLFIRFLSVGWENFSVHHKMFRVDCQILYSRYIITYVDVDKPCVTKGVEWNLEDKIHPSVCNCQRILDPALQSYEKYFSHVHIMKTLI